MTTFQTESGVLHIRLSGGAIACPRGTRPEFAAHLLRQFPAGTPSRRESIIRALREDAEAVEIEAQECLDQSESGEYD